MARLMFVALVVFIIAPDLGRVYAGGGIVAVVVQSVLWLAAYQVVRYVMRLLYAWVNGGG